MWKDLGDSGDSFYEVRPQCTDVPKTKFRVKAGKTLSSRRWEAAFTPEGYLNIGKILRRIYRGGIHPSIRGEVWEFLLGCYDPKSTFGERDQIRQRRREQYAVLKEECRQIFSMIGSGRFITAPVITEDGYPTQDPLVLQEANGAQRPTENGSLNDTDLVKETDPRIVQWKLTLHQIGCFSANII
nr:TBC1 domain family member 15-like isoform X1 [Ipomoea batatas]